MAFSTSESTLRDLLADIQAAIPGLPVCLKDLRNPRPEFMANYFQALLEDFGTDVEALLVPPRDQHFCEEFVTSYRVCRLLDALKAMYPDYLGLLNDMSFNTIMDPKPSDIQFVRTTINFLQFAQSRTYSVHDDAQVKEKEAELAKLREITDNVEEIREELRRQSVAHGHQKEKIVEIHQTIEEVKSQCPNLLLTLGQEKKKVEQLREMINKFQTNLNFLKEKRAQKADMAQRISICVVRSPDRIVASRQELKDKVQWLKSANELSSRKYFERKSKLQVMKSYIEELCVCFEIFEYVLRSAKQIEAYEHRLKRPSRKTTWWHMFGDDKRHKVFWHTNKLLAKKEVCEKRKLLPNAWHKEERKLQQKTEILKKELPAYMIELRCVKKKWATLKNTMDIYDDEFMEWYEKICNKIQACEDKTSTFIYNFERSLVKKYEKKSFEAKIFKEELQHFRLY